MTALTAALLAASLAAAPGPGASIRRFGLLVGSNDGGASRPRLRYAASDAEGMARVLGRLGGMAPEDTVLLLEASRAQLAAGLSQMRDRAARARAQGARTELIFYYSGHADEGGLLLGKERLAYSELRSAIDGLPADVRVAILDSCHAGSFVRFKGGKRVAPFLVDASSAVAGHAFLTSSSADEAAQESDRIRSSYFTFALLGGLRGAADTSGDGKVTLTEAYQFAFQETLARTEASMAGPQHPAYDIHLAGTGDLVMTDLRAQSAGLVVPPDLAGRLYVRDDAGRLVVELHHFPGQALELGLEPGAYGIRLDTGAGQVETRAVLEEGKRLALRRADFGPARPGEPVAKRGDDPLPRQAVHLSLWPPVSTAGAELPVAGLSLNLFYGRIAELRGLEVGAGVNRETRSMSGVQIGLANIVDGPAHGIQYGLANLAEGESYGYQAAAFFSHAGGSFQGVQNGGFYAAVGGDLTGLQSALYGSVGGEVRGVQVSLVNRAGTVYGAQAGLVNVAGGDATLQLGLVNVGQRAGLMAGLVNVADHADAPIGLVSWIRDGYRSAGVWASDVAPTQVGVKLGGRYLYSLLAVGARPSSSQARYFATFGLGVHLPLAPAWALDVDASNAGLLGSKGDRPEVNHASLRALVLRDLWPGVALQVGPTWNVVVGRDGADADLALLPQSVRRRGATTVRQFPGFALGFQVQRPPG